MSFALYTAYHKPAPLLQSPSVRPIHVGRAGAPAPLPGMAGDDTGLHISDKNPAYCELTALYWAWKNDTDASHIGLMHYRRVPDFDGQYSGSDAELFVSRFDISDWLARTEAWLETHGDSYDLIVPRVHKMGLTVAQNYRAGHVPADLERTRDIIAAHHPGYLTSFDAICAGYDIRLGNICVMRRDLMDGYCAWLFDILARLDAADVDRSAYSAQQSRYSGFVAERLLTVYVHHLQASQPDLRVYEPGIINLSQALITPWVNDDSLNGPAHVNVACAADRAYLPHTAAMLHSMLAAADPARQINVFFLASGIKAADLALLGEVMGTHPLARLHVLPVNHAFDASYRSASRAPSNATYNRFLLFDLLPGLDRLLYVDGDMIFHGDVCGIFDTDMGTAQIGAVPDYIMTRTLTGPTPTTDPDVPDLAAYHRDVLGLSDAEIARYFNAGLLLLNFAAMDVPATGAALVRAAQNTRYLFRDQDILNVHFKDSLLLLDARYNVFNTHVQGYDRVPARAQAAAMAARRAPLVTHYAAGDYKPWTAVSVPRAQYYWQALARTPFYAEVLADLARAARRTVSLRARARTLAVSAGKSLATRFPALRPLLIRGYQRLRRMSAR